MGLNHTYLRHILNTNAIHLAGYGWLDGGRLGVETNGLESLTEGRPYGIIFELSDLSRSMYIS